MTETTTGLMSKAEMDKMKLQSVAQEVIADECDKLREMLLAKNRSYGNSFANPIRIFAKRLVPEAQILVRLDDKLKRIVDGTEEMNEDTIQDLIGYLVLLRVFRRMSALGAV